MKLSDFTFTPDNHFVALEYYYLILNRTYLVLITEKELIGLKVHGMISASSSNPLDNLVLEKLLKSSISGDLEDPYAYLDAKYLDKIKYINLLSDDFLKADKANFRIDRSQISNAVYDPSKKWGMGPYPHDGKVYVETRNEQKREFIILGNQSGERIKKNLNRTQNSI